MARLALATHNAHKVGEIWAILAPLVPGLGRGDVASAVELGAPSPVEDGVTFAENALIKARALAAATGLPAIADDSGISVDVMGHLRSKVVPRTLPNLKPCDKHHTPRFKTGSFPVTESFLCRRPAMTYCVWRHARPWDATVVVS